MSLQHTKFADINEQHLKSLIDNSVSEGKSLEYKESLPGDSRDERKEFLYDVTSFANASGGDIIYGISELTTSGSNTGIAGTLSGITNVNADQEILKFEGIIRDGVEPRIIGHHFRAIRLSNGNDVIILRIPKSLHGPHGVTIYGGLRFYSRKSAGKYKLDVGELRSAFLGQYHIKDVLYRFIAEKVANIIAGEAHMPIVDGAKAIFLCSEHQATG